MIYKIIVLFFLCFFFHFYSFGQTDLDSLKSAITFLKNDSVKIKTLIQLSRQIHREDANDEDDFLYAQQAADLAESYGDYLLWAESLDNLGLLHRFHSRYAQAVPLHRNALDLIKEKAVDPYYKMRFANNLAVAARYNQFYDVAVENYLYSLRIAEVIQDLRNIAIASNGLGNALSQLEDKDEESLIYFLKALEAEKIRENSLGIAMNYLSLSNYYSRKGDFVEARNYLELLLQINQERNDQHGLAMTYEYFGHTYFEERTNLPRAKAYYRQALEQFEELDQVHKVAAMHLALGDLAVRDGDPSGAMSHFNMAYEIAQHAGNKAVIMEAAQSMASTSEKSGNYVAALAFYKTAEAYRDSIKLNEQETTIAGMKMEFDFEKKESEIQLLRTENDLKEQEMKVIGEKFKRDRLLYGGMLISLLTTTLFIILLLHNQNLRKTLALQKEAQKRSEMEASFQNNLLQAEILASRMQMNPHFLFNCLNAIKLLIQKGSDKAAIKYLTTLSKFIRDLLQTGKHATISLAKEIDLTRKYIELEKNRFDQQFQVDFTVNQVNESRLQEAQIPPLLLQPFVENAIWHGLLPSKSEYKRLHIILSPKDSRLMIRIRDNGIGRDAKSCKKSHKSMGVPITRQRIDLFNQLSESKLTLLIIDLKDDKQKASGTEVLLELYHKTQLETKTQP